MRRVAAGLALALFGSVTAVGQDPPSLTWSLQSDYFGDQQTQPRRVKALGLSHDGYSVFTGFVEDTGNGTHTIRKIKSSILAIEGTDTAIFGNGAGPGATGAAGPVGSNPIYPPTFSADGFQAWTGVANEAPHSIATDERTYVYVAFLSGNLVRVYDASLATVVGAISVTAPSGVDVRLIGDTHYAYIATGTALARWDVSDPSSPTLDATWTPPVTEGAENVAVDVDGTVFISGGDTIRRISADGTTITHTASVEGGADLAIFQDGLYVLSHAGPTVTVVSTTDLSAMHTFDVPDMGIPRGGVAQLTAIDISVDGEIYIAEERYQGQGSGISGYTPPPTSFNPNPSQMPNRVIFDRVLISSPLVPNDPPVVTSAEVTDGGVYQVRVGDTFDASFTGTDPEGRDLLMTATGLPPGATLTPSSGTTSASPFDADFSFAPASSDFGVSYDVEISYEDSVGNVASLSFTIEVLPNELPTVTTPTPVFLECTGSEILLTLSVDVDDLDDQPLTVSWRVDGVVEQTTVENAPATVAFEHDYAYGQSDVTIEVFDGFDTATAATTVTVQDTTSPTILVAADKVVPTDPGKDFATGVVLQKPTVFDACDGDPKLTNDAPPAFPLGTTIVTWTATDADGNVSTGTQKVTVVDREPPKIVCGDDIEVFVDPGEIFATPNLRKPDVSDNCPGAIQLSNDAPSTFPIGSTKVTWTAVDKVGNEATCSLKVKVVNRKPIAHAGVNRLLPATSKRGRDVTLNGRGSRDPDDQDLTFLWSAPGVAFDDRTSPTPTGRFPVGVTRATLTVTDEAGVSDRASVRIEIEYRPKLVVDTRPYGAYVSPYVETAATESASLAATAPENKFFAAASDYAELAREYDVAAASIEYVNGNDYPGRLGLYLHLRYYQAFFDDYAAYFLHYGYVNAPHTGVSFDDYAAAYLAAASAAYYGWADFQAN